MVKQYPHSLYIDQPDALTKDESGNWVSEGAPFNPQIGDVYQGGIIFYVDQTGKHGLMCAQVDQSNTMRWYNGSFVQTNALRTGIGQGLENTLNIIEAQGIGLYAAAVCKLYNGGGNSDWVLPSKDELQLMHEKLHVNGIGNFSILNDSLYWSSTESDNSIIDAWYLQFNSGTGDYDGKDLQINVRAIRAF